MRKPIKIKGLKKPSLDGMKAGLELLKASGKLKSKRIIKPSVNSPTPPKSLETATPANQTPPSAPKEVARPTSTVVHIHPHPITEDLSRLVDRMEDTQMQLSALQNKMNELKEEFLRKSPTSIVYGTRNGNYVKKEEKTLVSYNIPLMVEVMGVPWISRYAIPKPYVSVTLGHTTLKVAAFNR